MKKSIYFILTILTFYSCEDQLEIQNPNQLTADTFYVTEEDAIQSVNSIYSKVISGPGTARWMSLMGNTRADLMKSEAVNATVVNIFDRFIVNNYNQGQLTTVWSELYVIIYRANQALDNIPNIDMDENLKNRLIGEARFLRGWAYYYLGLYWGNVPLMLETSNPDDRPESSTQEEVWQQAIADFEIADSNLPLKSEYPLEDLGRATKGAAKAMLGKTHMMLKDYESALNPLEWLVEGDGASEYSLVDNYRNNFLSTTENNSESVFEIQYEENPLESGGNDLANPDQLNYGTSIPPFNAPQPIGFNTVEFNQWVVWEFLKERTVNGNRDPRVEATFLYDSTDIRGPEFTEAYGQTWMERYPNRNANQHNKVMLRKFLNDATQDVENFRSPNNYRNIRYADVLLLYAETLNELGRTTDAYEYVNRVRERANLERLQEARPQIGTNQNLFLEQLKHERITELAGEAHRWADLVRWDMLSPELSERDAGFENFEVGKDELLPIPQQDIDFNPNLTQNPGW